MKAMYENNRFLVKHTILITTIIVVLFLTFALFKGKSCCPVFAEETPLKMVTVEMDSNDNTGSEIGTLEFIKNADNGSYSEWIFTSKPAKGYYLSHLHNISTGVDIESDDGLTVTWKERKDGAEYYAVFKKVVAEPVSLKPATLFQRVFDKQKAIFTLSFKLAGILPAGKHVYIKLYAGEDTSGDPLTKTEYYVEGSEIVGNDYVLKETDMKAGKHSTDLKTACISKEYTKLTVVTKAGEDGPISRSSFDLKDVYDSGEIDLTYLDIPGRVTDSDIGGTTLPFDKGPGVLDAASFIDDRTGELHTYFATTSGVVYSDGSDDYRSMTVGGGEANVLAIGGPTEDDLFAVACGGNGKDISVYKRNGNAFEAVPESSIEWEDVSNSKEWSLSGIVMSGDDIWLDNVHWDGNEWASNEIKFNSFHRGGSEAYATSKDGTHNGLYRYEDGSWILLEEDPDGYMILSGIEREGKAELLLAKNCILKRRAESGTLESPWDLKKVTIVGTDIISETIAISPFATHYCKGAGLDHDGNIYILRYSGAIGSGGGMFGLTYWSSEIYKYTDGEWIYQHAEAFDTPDDIKYIENGEYDKKERPDGVRYTISPVKGVTYFLGQAGAVYALYNDSTITFDSEGGNEIEPITRKICSKVNRPKAPVKSGAVFGGWYTDLDDPDSRYNFNVMPAKDITLHARWLEEGSPEYEEYINDLRVRSLKTLDEAFEKFNGNSYDPADWTQLNNIYNSGRQNIENADNEDEIIDILNQTIEQMLEIKPIKRETSKVCLTMELFTLNEGYIIKPTLITVPQNEQISVILTEQLKKQFPGIAQPWRMTGSVKSGFYLSSVYKGNNNWIGEFDHGDQSGWMYAVNNTFPSVGASSWTVEDGDVIRWQYTVEGLGADLGTSEEWQQGGEQVAIVADKDALTWLVAEVNAKIEEDAEYLSKYDLTDSYNSAMTALTTMYSSQEEVDAAEEALQTSFNDAIKKEKAAQLRAEISEEIESASGINNEDGKYTEESFKAYKAAVAAAEKILAMPENEVDNDTLSATLKAIKDAKANLVETTDQSGDSGDGSGDEQGSGDGGDSGSGTEPGGSGDGEGSGSGNEEQITKVRADLNTALTDAEKITNADGRYTAESYKALMDAVNFARQTLANSTVTLEQLNLALDAVTKAKTGLVEATPSDDKKDSNKEDPKEGDTSVEPVKKAVVINSKKVTAAVVKKALKKANNANATVVTIGKKVKTIKKGAFKKTKIKTLIVKTKKLKKASVKGCLKSSKVKTIKVKAGNKKVNKSFVKKYRKIFTKKNAGRKVRVK